MSTNKFIEEIMYEEFEKANSYISEMQEIYDKLIEEFKYDALNNYGDKDE